MEPNQLRCTRCGHWFDFIGGIPCEKCQAEWQAERAAEDRVDEDRAIAEAARKAGMVDEHGKFRQVIGTLPRTGDVCICGMPPDFGHLFGRGKNCPIDRYKPVHMRYDAQRRCVVLVVDGLFGGMDFNGIPISELYRTREAAEAARKKES